MLISFPAKEARKVSFPYFEREQIRYSLCRTTCNERREVVPCQISTVNDPSFENGPKTSLLYSGLNVADLLCESIAKHRQVFIAFQYILRGE